MYPGTVLSSKFVIRSAMESSRRRERLILEPTPSRSTFAVRRESN